MKRFRGATLGLALLFSSVSAADAGDLLRGSRRSMERQHGIAVENGYEFVETTRDARDLLATGELVDVRGNADYDVSRVRYRYALPEVKLFLERLGRQYREQTGEALVVTSLARPAKRQPSNAHALSVHPAGMAIDLRVPRDPAHRAWLEAGLLGLEDRGAVDVTRERRPPHYHVAIYPEAYADYAEEKMRAEALERTRTAAAVTAASATVAGAAAAAKQPVRLNAAAAASRPPAWLAPAVLLLGFAVSAAAQRLRGREPRRSGSGG